MPFTTQLYYDLFSDFKNQEQSIIIRGVTQGAVEYIGKKIVTVPFVAPTIGEVAYAAFCTETNVVLTLSCYVVDPLTELSSHLFIRVPHLFIRSWKTNFPVREYSSLTQSTYRYDEFYFTFSTGRSFHFNKFLN